MAKKAQKKNTALICPHCEAPLDVATGHLQEVLNANLKTIDDLRVFGSRFVGTYPNGDQVYGYREAYFIVKSSADQIESFKPVQASDVFALLATPHGEILLTKNTFRSFVEICSELSPEWLHEDGEASEERVQQKLAQYAKDWKQVEEESGLKISVGEFENAPIRPVYDWRNLKLYGDDLLD